MNTEDISFRLRATVCNVNMYEANFAGCEIELSEDKQFLQLIDENEDYETWVRDETGGWIFRDGSNGQAPTRHWRDDYHTFLEAAIDAL